MQKKCLKNLHTRQKGDYLCFIIHEKSRKMTYAQLETARKAHEHAAKDLRWSGFKAKVFKNKQCEQPYEIKIKASIEELNVLQPMMEGLYKYPINLVQE